MKGTIGKGFSLGLAYFVLSLRNIKGIGRFDKSTKSYYNNNLHHTIMEENKEANSYEPKSKKRWFQFFRRR